MVILERVDTFAALIGLSIDVAGERVHPGVVRHQSTIPSARRELFTVPDGGHLSPRGAHHAGRAATTAIRALYSRFLLVLLPTTQPEEHSHAGNEADSSKDTNRDAHSSACCEAVARCRHLAIASCVVRIAGRWERDGDLAGPAIRSHSRYYHDWRGGGV